MLLSDKGLISQEFRVFPGHHVNLVIQGALNILDGEHEDRFRIRLNLGNTGCVPSALFLPQPHPEQALDKLLGTVPDPLRQRVEVQKAHIPFPIQGIDLIFTEFDHAFLNRFFTVISLAFYSVRSVGGTLQLTIFYHMKPLKNKEKLGSESL